VRRVSRKIWNQNFNTGPGGLLMDLPDCLCIKPGTLVWKIISSHSCDSGIPQLHLRNRFANSSGFIGVKGSWAPGVYLAEITASGALRATDQESGFSIFPTLKNVWATSFLADSVEILSLDQ
jgi:hypothetical protein